jgi:hypothetical protein
MGKGLGVMIAGIFVGAVGMEIFRRACPNAVDKLYTKVRETASGAAEAFKNGYEKVTRPEEALEPVA